MSNDLQIPWLTPDDARWRIDWFGEVAYPGVVRQYRQPCIRVSISPVHEGADRAGTSLTDIRRQRNVWVPFGCLARLCIGDIWQHGKLLESPWQSQILVDLRITPQTTRFVKAGLAVDEHYLLPFAEHPWHRLHTQSYCLAVDAPDDMTLFIPAAELIRFYFGSSGSLLRRLVEHPLKEEALWKSKNIDPETQHLHLKLADGLPGVSAADIGRIAMDPSAWGAASSVFSSCVKATSQGLPAYPCIGFPFQGETNLVAQGMYLPFGDEAKRNFLAFRLKHCSHAFPFRTLTYETGDWIARRRNAGADGGNATTPQKSSNMKSESVLGYGDPGVRKKVRRYEFDHTWRFSDLKGKSVWQENIIAKTAGDVLMRRADGAVEQLAFGDQMGAGSARAIDVQSNFSQGEPVSENTEKLPRFIRVGMALVVSRYLPCADQSVELIKPANMAAPVFQLPVVIDEDGMLETDLIYTEPDGSHRQKRACFVGEVSEGIGIAKFAVIEGGSLKDEPTVQRVASCDVLDLIVAKEKTSGAKNV